MKLAGLSPPVKYLYWCFVCGSFMLLKYCICSRARLYINALWSPAGKGLASWLSFVMSNCEVATFKLLSWVRCGA